VATAAGLGAAADFAAATAVAPAGDGQRGAYEAVCSTAWSAPRGPNGGYLAAIVLRAMQAEAGDPPRHPRSLTCHYLRPPTDGPVRIEVVVEREGRSVTALSARLLQRGRPCVVALAALSRDFAAAEDWAQPAPAAPPPEELDPWPLHPGAPPITHRLSLRPVFGGRPFAGADEALTGGWLRVAEPVPPDAPLLAFYADAWLPAPFPRLTTPVAAPTIDLTVHFRVGGDGIAAALDPRAPVLARFTSSTSAGGFFEEDGALWSPDGTLLAQSRQLALLFPMGGAAA
jgi:acyl-CoA thioesterase